MQGALQAELTTLQAQHSQLIVSHAELHQQHQAEAAAAVARQATLQTELQELTEVHVSVLNQLSEATAEVNELGDLAQDHTQLRANFANLELAHTQLQECKAALDSEQALLQSKAEAAVS